jgi:hypothetical protein
MCFSNCILEQNSRNIFMREKQFSILNFIKFWLLFMDVEASCRGFRECVVLDDMIINGDPGSGAAWYFK